jgi:excisionase family DNA binding protein
MAKWAAYEEERVLSCYQEFFKLRSKHQFNQQPLDLSDWSQVERYVNGRAAREQRLATADDVLHEVRAAIREHDHQHRKLMDQGELVMPEESNQHGEDLRNVEWHLVHLIERLTNLLDEPSEDMSMEPDADTKADSAPSQVGGDPDDLLSLPRVAMILGVSESKVYKMSANRELPITKIGHKVRVQRRDLQQWLQSHTTKGRKRRG